MNRETGTEPKGTGPAPSREWDEVPLPRLIFGSLASDPRLPIWIGRLVMAAAAGIAVGIWQDWRLGVTAAAVVAIADTIYRSRTTSVIPAAVRVTSAQRRTRRRLILVRPAGYVAVHNRAIPATAAITARPIQMGSRGSLARLPRIRRGSGISSHPGGGTAGSVPLVSVPVSRSTYHSVIE